MRRKKKLSNVEQIEEKIKKEYKFLRRFKDKNENHLLFAAFLVVMTSMVVVNTLFIIDYVPERRAGTALADPHKVLTSLQRSATEAYVVNVSNVTVNDKEDNAFGPAPGETILILDISITNVSSGQQQLVPASQFFVRDRQGGLYLPHPSSYVTAPLNLVMVDPGSTITGQLSFAIPKILAHPLLYVDLGWNDTAPIVIDVMK